MTVSTEATRVSVIEILCQREAFSRVVPHKFHPLLCASSRVSHGDISIGSASYENLMNSRTGPF
ncbi:hypothetical protein EAO75_17975 [Streptomyces sp. uw30]|nr:hypothetical protein EAO75_17975 [Streptomyces sp. uw30]